MANIFTKGALCLAFAAALTGCGPKPEQQANNNPQQQTQQVEKIDLSKTTPAAIAWRMMLDVDQASELYMEAYKAQYDFRAGTIPQEQFDKIVKEKAEAITKMREPYTTNRALAKAFDDAYANTLRPKEQKFKALHPEAAPQGGLRLSGPAQELIAELVKLAAGQMAEDIRVAAGTEALGPASQNPALQGISTRQAIFPGGPLQYLTVLDATALKAGGIYSYTGKLSINGDLPENVTLNVNGKLVVNGNVASGDKLSVQQPENTRTEKYDCWNWAYGASVSQPNNMGYHYGMRDDACTRTLPDGLKYKNDPEPAIHITGSAANNAGLYTNGGKIALDGGRVTPVVTAPAPAVAQPPAPTR